MHSKQLPDRSPRPRAALGAAIQEQDLAALNQTSTDLFMPAKRSASHDWGHAECSKKVSFKVPFERAKMKLGNGLHLQPQHPIGCIAGAAAARPDETIMEAACSDERSTRLARCAAAECGVVVCVCV